MLVLTLEACPETLGEKLLKLPNIQQIIPLEKPDKQEAIQNMEMHYDFKRH